MPTAYAFTNSQADGDLDNADNYDPVGTPLGVDTVSISEGMTISAGTCAAPATITASGLTTITVDGGTFSSTVAITVTSGSGVFNLNGGTLTGAVTADVGDDGVLTVSGGSLPAGLTVSSVGANGTLTFTGGSLASLDVAASGNTAGITFSGSGVTVAGATNITLFSSTGTLTVSAGNFAHFGAYITGANSVTTISAGPTFGGTFDVTLQSGGSATLNIDGVTIAGNATATAEDGEGSIDIGSSSTVTFNGDATFTGAGVAVERVSFGGGDVTVTRSSPTINAGFGGAVTLTFEDCPSIEFASVPATITFNGNNLVKAIDNPLNLSDITLHVITGKTLVFAYGQTITVNGGTSFDVEDGAAGLAWGVTITGATDPTRIVPDAGDVRLNTPVSHTVGSLVPSVTRKYFVFA